MLQNLIQNLLSTFSKHSVATTAPARSFEHVDIGRGDLRLFMVAQEEKESKAAIRIQSVLRGMLTRRAAIRIQLAAAQDEKEKRAATCIQSAFRGMLARGMIDACDAAAIHIQATYRGAATRDKLKAEKANAQTQVRTCLHQYPPCISSILAINILHVPFSTLTTILKKVNFDEWEANNKEAMKMKPIRIPSLVLPHVKCYRTTSRSKHEYEQVGYGMGTFEIIQEGNALIGVFKSDGRVFLKAKIPLLEELHRQLQADRDGDPCMYWQAFNEKFEECGRRIRGFEEGKSIACRMYYLQFSNLQGLTLALDRMTRGNVDITTREFFAVEGRFHDDKYLKLAHKTNAAENDMDVDLEEGELEGGEKYLSDDEAEEMLGGNPYEGSQEILPPPLFVTEPLEHLDTVDEYSSY